MKRSLRKREPRGEEEEAAKKVEENPVREVGSIAQLNVTYHANDRAPSVPSGPKDEYRIDYARGLCKDFHETGYCVFGDECIFMHDRTTWMAGEGELSAEWREQKKRNLGLDKIRDAKKPKVVSETGGCVGCKRELKPPVMVAKECKHLYCQSCALKQVSKCAQCGSLIQGRFTINHK